MHFRCDVCNRKARVESLTELPEGWMLMSGMHACDNCTKIFSEDTTDFGSNGNVVAWIAAAVLFIVLFIVTVLVS